jgi:hypothetical protein
VKDIISKLKMKNVLLAMVLFAVMVSCGPTTGESGANDDGIKAVDSNGAFRDDTAMQYNPATDTAIGEDRVDIQKRDSVK